MTYNVGDKIPVWWTTFDKDENGNNLAFVLEIRDYIGPFDFCSKILKLTCPNTKRGWIEMTV
jgi:hypothetical protein